MGSQYHLNCSSGLAGDMFLGACLDLGMPLELLSEVVRDLDLPEVGVEARRTRRGGIQGTRFRVLLRGQPIEGPDPEEEAPTQAGPRTTATKEDHGSSPPGPHRSLTAIRRMIEGSTLAAAVRERAVDLFVRLGEAEAKVHGVAVDRVHFHELGAIDSIVDLVGAAAAVEYLNPSRMTCGPVVVGGGTVGTEHGRMPVPAPATAELLRGIPIQGSEEGELLTPTGAVLLAELVDTFEELPCLVIEEIGYGLGRRELGDRVNATRLLKGREEGGSGEVLIVETEIDDLPGEGFGFLMERLFESSCLDVFFTPVQMKKNRPGTLVTLLCRSDQLDTLCGVLMTHSGALGCRYYPARRFEAERDVINVATSFGEVRVKQARFRGRTINEAPEYEDCRRLALERGVSWRDVYQAAMAQRLATRSSEGR